MSSTIKDRLFILIKKEDLEKEYIDDLSLKETAIVFIVSVLFVFGMYITDLYVFDGYVPSSDIETIFFGLATFIFAIFIFIASANVFFSLFTFLTSFSSNKKKILIQKQFSKQFGSVDTVRKLYLEFSTLGLEFSDRNILSFLKDRDKIKDKLSIINGKKNLRLSSIDSRIEKLMEEKELITQRSFLKGTKFLSSITNKRSKKYSDLSIDLPLEERVLIPVGGLK